MSTFDGRSSTYVPGKAPVNKEVIISNHSITKSYRIHREKIRNVKPMVDSRSSEEYIPLDSSSKSYISVSTINHLKWRENVNKQEEKIRIKNNELIYNRLKKQEEEESSLLKESKHHQKIMAQKLTFFNQLKSQTRLLSLVKIEKENEIILKRIKLTKPQYSVNDCKKWYKHQKSFQDKKKVKPIGCVLMKTAKDLLPKTLPPLKEDSVNYSSSMPSLSRPTTSLKTPKSRSSLRPLTSGTSVLSRLSLETLKMKEKETNEEKEVEITEKKKRKKKKKNPSFESEGKKLSSHLSNSSISSNLKTEDEDEEDSDYEFDDQSSLSSDASTDSTATTSSASSLVSKKKKISDYYYLLASRPFPIPFEGRNCVVEIYASKAIDQNLYIRVISSGFQLGNSDITYDKNSVFYNYTSEAHHQVLTEKILSVDQVYEIVNSSGNSSKIVHSTDSEDLQSLSSLLINMFKEADEDGSGSLTFDEFQVLMEKIEIGISSQELRFVISEADENNNGVIDYEEFVPLAVDLIQSFRARNKAKEVISYNDIKIDNILCKSLSIKEIQASAEICLNHIIQYDSKRYGIIRKKELKKILLSISNEANLQENEINMLLKLLPTDQYNRIKYNNASNNFLKILYKIKFLNLKNNLLESNNDNLLKYLLNLCKNEEKNLEMNQNNDNFNKSSHNNEKFIPTGIIPCRSLINLLNNSKRLKLNRLQILVIMSEASVLDGMINYFQFIPIVSKTIGIMFEPKVLKERAELIENTSLSSSNLLKKLKNSKQNDDDLNELKKNLLTLFKSFDIDHDNYLSDKEFVACLNSFDFELNSNELLSFYYSTLTSNSSSSNNSNNNIDNSSAPSSATPSISNSLNSTQNSNSSSSPVNTKLNFDLFFNFFSNNLYVLEKEKRIRLLTKTLLKIKNNGKKVPKKNVKNIKRKDVILRDDYNFSYFNQPSSQSNEIENEDKNNELQKSNENDENSKMDDDNDSETQAKDEYDINFNISLTNIKNFEELLESLMSLFQLYDLNDTNYINLNDFKHILQIFHKNYSNFFLNFLLLEYFCNFKHSNSKIAKIGYDALLELLKELLVIFREKELLSNRNISTDSSQNPSSTTTVSNLSKKQKKEDEELDKKATALVNQSIDDINQIVQNFELKFNELSSQTVDITERYFEIINFFRNPSNNLTKIESNIILANLFMNNSSNDIQNFNFDSIFGIEAESPSTLPEFLNFNSKEIFNAIFITKKLSIIDNLINNNQEFNPIHNIISDGLYKELNSFTNNNQPGYVPKSILDSNNSSPLTSPTAKNSKILFTNFILPVKNCIKVFEKVNKLHKLKLKTEHFMYIFCICETFNLEDLSVDINDLIETSVEVINKLLFQDIRKIRKNIISNYLNESVLPSGFDDSDLLRVLRASYRKEINLNGTLDSSTVGKVTRLQIENILRDFSKIHLRERDIAIIISFLSFSDENQSLIWNEVIEELVNLIKNYYKEVLIQRRVSLFSISPSSYNSNNDLTKSSDSDAIKSESGLIVESSYQNTPNNYDNEEDENQSVVKINKNSKKLQIESLKKFKLIGEKLLNFIKIQLQNDAYIVSLPLELLNQHNSNKNDFKNFFQDDIPIYRNVLLMELITETYVYSKNFGSNSNPSISSSIIPSRRISITPNKSFEENDNLTNLSIFMKNTTPNYNVTKSDVNKVKKPVSISIKIFDGNTFTAGNNTATFGSYLVASIISFDSKLVLKNVSIPIKLSSLSLVDKDITIKFIHNFIAKLYLYKRVNINSKEVNEEKWILKMYDEENN